MADLRIDVAAEFKGKRAFTEASKATTGLEKAVGKLGKQIVGVFAVSKVIAFGKASVKAFAADEAAAVRLTSALKNLGLELAAPAVTQYIDNLSRATAVADDQLRPAFQALINTTGSLTASQRLLSQAIDVSAGSGIALETVAQDLANAYVGQTRGLRKYNLGLNQAQLKTASFEELMGKLNKQFSGANAAFLDTYAGKLQALGVAGGEAQEKIGGAVIDLAMALSGASDIDQLITRIETLTDKIVGMFDAFQEGISIIRGVLDAKTFGGMKDAIQKAQVDEFNRRMRRDYMKPWQGVDMPKSAAQKAAEAAAERAAKKRAADQLKVTKALTAEEKKRTALKKAGTVFDLDQIQIIAALKGKLSEEDRIRLQAQLAILNENDVLAASLTRQILMAQDSTGGLYKFFLAIGDMKIKNPFAFLDDWILEFQKKLNNLKFPTFDSSGGGGGGGGGGGKKPPIIDPFTNPFNFPIGAQGGIGTTSIQPTVSANLAIQDTFNAVMLDALEAGNNYTQSAILAISSARYEAAAQAYGMGGSTGGTMQLELKVTGDGDITNAIAKGLQNQSLSTGDSAYINRRTGGFAG